MITGAVTHFERDNITSEEGRLRPNIEERQRINGAKCKWRKNDRRGEP